MKSCFFIFITFTIATDLNETEAKNLKSLTKALNGIRNKTGQTVNYVVTNSVDGYNAYQIGNTIYIAQDQLDSDAWIKALPHETTHIAQTEVNNSQTQEYKEYSNEILSTLQKDEKYTEEGKQAISSLVSRGYFSQDEVNHIFKTQVEDYTSKDYEVVSALAKELPAVQSEKILGNENFIKRVTASDSIIGKIMTTLDNLKMKKNLSKEDYQTYNKVYNKYIKALESVGKAWQNGKVVSIKRDEPEFSIQKDENGFYVNIDTDQNIFDGVGKKDFPKIIKNYILEHFGGKTFPLSENDYVLINKIGAGKIAYSGSYQPTHITETKANLVIELENILKASTLVGTNEDNKNHPFATLGFLYYKTRFQTKEKTYSCILNIGLSDNGKILYDINQIKESHLISSIKADLKATLIVDDSSSTNIIDNNSKIVNNNFFLSESRDFLTKQYRSGKSLLNIQNTSNDKLQIIYDLFDKSIPEDFYQNISKFDVQDNKITLYSDTSKRFYDTKLDKASIYKTLEIIKNDRLSELEEKNKIENDKLIEKEELINKRTEKASALGLSLSNYQEIIDIANRIDAYNEKIQKGYQEQQNTKGYVSNQESERSVQAKINGEYPISVASRLFGVSRQTIKDNFNKSSWHHTSVMMNETDFYDLSEVVKTIDNITSSSYDDVLKSDGWAKLKYILGIKEVNFSLKEKAYTKSSVSNAIDHAVGNMYVESGDVKVSESIKDEAAKMLLKGLQESSNINKTIDEVVDYIIDNAKLQTLYNASGDIENKRIVETLKAICINSKD